MDRLRKMGVPESAIECFGGDVKSTRDEAYRVRRWLERHPARRLIVPTDPFHTRRVRFVFDRATHITPRCSGGSRTKRLRLSSGRS